jgi:hypothetical protein
MEIQIVSVYCLSDDLLIALGHQEDPQVRMSDAEVMTTAIVAALNFGGNFEKARDFLKTHNYIPNMLSKSQFNRRLHRIKELFLTLFSVLGETFKSLNSGCTYVIDTMPVAVCDNIRIRRCKIYQTEAHRGYQSLPRFIGASKKRYFYGVKVHVLVTTAYQPVEFFITAGSVGDVEGLQWFEFDLPEGSRVYADKAYNNYEIEDILSDVDVTLFPARKSNSKRPHQPWEAYLCDYYRKRVETAGSLISRLLPKSIHAVTQEGFELKVALFVLASAINCL